MIKQGKKAMEEFLPYQIDFTANFNKSFRREFFAKYITADITPDEISIMHLISENAQLSQSELAKFLFKGKAHVGKILNEMEARKLITRSVDIKNNMMIKKNEITKKGAKFLKLGDEKLELIKVKLGETFTEKELDQFIIYLKRLRKELNTLVDVKLK